MLVKSRTVVAVIAVLGLAHAGCAKRSSNLQVRYTGVLFLVGGLCLGVEPSLNGGSLIHPDSQGKKLDGAGAGILAVGAALLIGSYLVHPKDEPLDESALRQREITLKADALLHEAETAAGKDDCASVNALAPQIELLDPGVGAVLRANVAAARCLAARANVPLSTWLGGPER